MGPHSMGCLPCRAFADSKTLKDTQREQLFSEIQADGLIGYAIESNTAADISAQMLQTCAAPPARPPARLPARLDIRAQPAATYP